MYMKEKNGVIVGRLCYGYEHQREKYCYCSRKYPTAFLCLSHCVFSILMPFLWSTTFCVFRHPDKWNVWLASRNGKVCIQCLLLSAVYEYLIFWLGHRQYPSPWININELLRMKYAQIDKSKVIPHPLWEIAKIYLLEGKGKMKKGQGWKYWPALKREGWISSVVDIPDQCWCPWRRGWPPEVPTVLLQFSPGRKYSFSITRCWK